MTRQTRLSDYPKKPAVRHAVEIARELGLDVAGFEVAPNGTIRILTAAAFPAAPKDEFEAWERDGKL